MSPLIKVWTVSLPVVILNSPAVSDKRIGGDNPKFGTGRDIAGIIIWALGFSVEAVADQQKVCIIAPFVEVLTIVQYYYKSRNKIPKGLPTNVSFNLQI